jgi:hypothetical protein
MPYQLVKVGSKFAVKTTSGLHKGNLHGLTTKPKAQAQMRILESLIRGKRMK